jgi:serine/threonine protein kinase
MIPSSSGEYTDRFLCEALFLARLQHPAIPALYDYFFENGDWYLVMDYIPGRSLTEHMHNHCPMPPLEALGYAMQLCEVLDYLHRQASPIIFRDLKPSNILLKPDSTLVLIDFGVARYVNDEAVNDNVTISSSEYVAPEQHGNEVLHDTRSDLYSLGVILYEMLTGQRPQEGEELTALQSINPPLSSALSGLVKLAIRTNPDQRFQSAYTLYLALEHAYKIEERQLYQRHVLSQMGDFCNKKETLILPTMQLENLKDESTTPQPSVKPEKIPHTETELITALPLPSLEQRQYLQYLRETLHRARQERPVQTQLASVDGSLKRHSLQSQQSHSQTAQQAIQKRHQSPIGPPSVVQPRSRGIQQPVTRSTITLRITSWRLIQVSFLLAIVVFLVMSSLLVYQYIMSQRENNTFLYPTPTTLLYARPTWGDNQKAADSSWQILPTLIMLPPILKSWDMPRSICKAAILAPVPPSLITTIITYTATTWRQPPGRLSPKIFQLW